MSKKLEIKKINSLWVSTIYYAQGLPFSLVRQLSVVFFKDRGASLDQLGLISLYGIPWTFKFLWSPFVDTKFTKRKWVLGAEFLLILLIGIGSSLIGMGASNQILASLFLVVAFVSATHDIAIDGFYLESFDNTGRAKYSGLLNMASRLAYMTGGGLLVSLAGKKSWALTFAVAAGIFLFLFFWHFFILPKNVEAKGSENNNKKSFTEGFVAFLKMPKIGVAIAFVLTFKLGDALLFGMSTPFLLDSFQGLGHTAGEAKVMLGFYSGIFGVLTAILASVSGGWLIAKYGLRKMLWIFGFIQNFAIPIYALVAWLKPGVPWLVVAIIAEQFAAGWGGSAYANFVMRLNNPNYKATHYAIATGMMSLTMMMGGVLSGFGAKNFGYTMFFTYAFVASIPGMILIPFIAKRPECQ